ncbi:hypothetical protein [Moorena sp. SIO2C4]|uniref:hypothetical protein n=1 Tax=Moorena sp. SIO2C4 TaxID=2607824 RepID=UPI0013CD317F|nr:hypothetical protein [Moorena sp. SIO2C4]NES43098.1 hypothetical protein [Moorena sp. SIO2C4]
MAQVSRTKFSIRKLIFRSSLVTLSIVFSASYTWAFGLDDIIPKVKVPKLPGGINEEIEDVIDDAIDGAVDEIIPYGIPRSIEELVDLLFGALAKDYGVIQQTPYSAGYNEVLIVSPSTGAEQRMQVNLPEEEFRIYEIAFKGVSVPKPKAVVGGQSPLQESEIKDRLSEFKIEYDDQNKVQAIILADGTKAKFSNSQAIIYGASGQTIETITLSQANANPSENYIALKNTGKQKCKSNVKQRLQATLDNANLKNLKLAQLGTSDEARLLAWAGTFGREGLADSLLPDSRNQTIQSISCQAPVQCNVKHTYKGASEVRTDLFKIPPGTNPKVALEYEFYTIPDRLEIFYEGSRIFGVGPKSGRDTKRIGNLPDNAKYVGVKVIGNRDEGTRWWYTIHCSNTGVEAIPEPKKPESQNLPVVLGIDRWWATATSNKDQKLIEVTWTVEVTEDGDYELEIDDGTWDATQLKAVIPIDTAYQWSGEDPEIDFYNTPDLDDLKKGTYKFIIEFEVPKAPVVDEIEFTLAGSGNTSPSIKSLFVADHPEVAIANLKISIDGKENVIRDHQELVNLFSPILKFDSGRGVEGGPEKHIGSIDVENYLLPNTSSPISWENLLDKTSYLSGSSESIINLSGFEKGTPEKSPTKTYAAVVKPSNNAIAINYYFHYTRSNWSDHDGKPAGKDYPGNTHEGDWEGITVFLERHSNGIWHPKTVAYAQHTQLFGYIGANFDKTLDGGQEVPWEHVLRNGSQPHVYVGLGGHASYPFPGQTRWPDVYGYINKNMEYHRGDGIESSPTVEYLPRVGQGYVGSADNLTSAKDLAPSWLLFPGRWGQQDVGVAFRNSDGNDGPLGPVFQSLGFDPGERWLAPWSWAEDFEEVERPK